MNKYGQKVNIDLEWVELIKEAKVMGYTLEEIRLVLSMLKQKQQITF